MSPSTRKVAKAHISGPLGPHQIEIEARFHALGYSPVTIALQIGMLAGLSRWLDREGIETSAVTYQCLERFAAEQKRGGRVATYPRTLFVLVLEVIYPHGIPSEAAGEVVLPTAIDILMGSFERYLLGERALAKSTTDAYVLRVRRFLSRSAPTGRVEELRTKDVTDAIRTEASNLSVGSTQFFVVAVRSFLRFCFREALTPADLAGSALPVTGRRSHPLPLGITTSDAQKLIASCDRRRSAGRRDYAILLLFLRLGLRASDIVSLKLEDINWSEGLITVHGKNSRVEQMPLSTEVGQALAGYLSQGRPACTCREVFIRSMAPLTGLGRGGVSDIVRRACERSGLPEVGPHLLRHTVAGELLQAGAGLPEVSQLLRHTNLISTSIYARVDVTGLRSIARPWPETAQ